MVSALHKSIIDLGETDNVEVERGHLVDPRIQISPGPPFLSFAWLQVDCCQPHGGRSPPVLRSQISSNRPSAHTFFHFILRFLIVKFFFLLYFTCALRDFTIRRVMQFYKQEAYLYSCVPCGCSAFWPLRLLQRLPKPA